MCKKHTNYATGRYYKQWHLYKTKKLQAWYKSNSFDCIRKVPGKNFCEITVYPD